MGLFSKLQLNNISFGMKGGDFIINHRNEQLVKFLGIFFGLIILSVTLFILLGTLLNLKGDEGTLVGICIVISIQVSALTALLFIRRKH
jgi:hypothetical protein